MSMIDNHDLSAGGTTEPDRNPGTARRATIIIIAVALALCLGVAAYILHPWGGTTDVHVHTAIATRYTCPMHPQIIRDQPGECPICHMELVPVRGTDAAIDTGSHATAKPGADALRITPEGRITAEVGTVRAAYRYMSIGIDAAAAVDYNEATHRVVSARYGGRIERLYARETGQMVGRGAPLMDIYSAELVTAQQDYLIARDARNLHMGMGVGDGDSEERMRERSARLVAASRKRLELLGMSAAQITALEGHGEVAYTTTVFSPESGVVLKRGATEGAYVAEGTMLLELADLSSVWVVANVGEAEVNRLKQGMTMRLSGPALNGEKLDGRVDYIYPAVDPDTRTVRVRGLFANPRLLLKPGMYVSATISMPSRDVLAVPAGAVIRTGRRDLVYVEVGTNTFEPREVTLGLKDGDYYEIAGGDLKEGDNVVAEGGFLLDSESRLSIPAGRQAARGTSGTEGAR
ncbi:MAG: Membrane-fusion protein [Chlorobi bacterium]|nr:Membrane-fusion protein [Chlorobiota bacterium]